MPTSTAPFPAPVRAVVPPPRRRRTAGPLVIAVRLLTVLVGLATAAVVLGPPSLVTAGMDVARGWLEGHPGQAALVDSLGGIEPAGNLVLFAPFAALLALSVALPLLPVAFLALVCAPIAAEWTQQFLPGRVPDGADVVRNTIGLLAAFTAVALVRLAVRTLRWTVRRL